jgi:hypothetical protein
MAMHVTGSILEVGVIGVTLASFLSELRDEKLSGDHRDHHREIMMTATSLALTIITLGITILGAGDTLSGLALAGKRISAAGNAVVSKVLGSVKLHREKLERKVWPDAQALNENA